MVSEKSAHQPNLWFFAEKSGKNPSKSQDDKPPDLCRLYPFSLKFQPITFWHILAP